MTERLLQDFPQLFIRCSPDVMHCSSADVDKGIANGVLVDFRKKGSFFECTSVAAIRDICDKVCFLTYHYKLPFALHVLKGNAFKCKGRHY